MVQSGLVGEIKLDFLLLHQLHQTISGHRLGPFQRKTKGTIPDQGGQDTKSTGNAEQNSVVVHLLQAIILKHTQIHMSY